MVHNVRYDSMLSSLKLAIHKEDNAFNIAAAVRYFKTQQLLSFYNKPIDKTWYVIYCK